MKKEYVDWADTKYRPQSFGEVQPGRLPFVGNEWVVTKLRRFVRNGNFPNVIFTGPSGVGKTCAAEILCGELEVEMVEWNASDQRRLKDIRETIKPFARIKPLDAPFRVAFMDECEYLERLAQPALRRIMEKYSRNCRFILSTNELYKIIYQIRSRCGILRFRELSEDEIFGQLAKIVELENLFDIITESQTQKIASQAKGDMRMAIKSLQILCEGKDEPVEDDDINVLIPAVPIKEVEVMLEMALDGKFTKSVNKFIEIAALNDQRAIFECIESIFKGYGGRGLSTKDRAVIASGLGRITDYMLGNRKAMYAFLAYLGGVSW